MGRHWRPSGNVVRLRPRRKWTRLRDYGAASGARGPNPWVLAIVAGVAAGLIGATWWPQPTSPASAQPDSTIEWNAVQALPKPIEDADDVAWRKRTVEEERPAAGSGRAGGAVAGQDIYVIDGDTFDLNGERIRVAGIDAPETHPARCPREAALGATATQKLAELLRRKPLWISGNITDRWGRDVRTVRVGREDVADAMIGSGLARNYDGKPRARWC